MSKLSLSVFSFILFSFSAFAEVSISDATVRLLPPSVPNTSAYFDISNQSKHDLVLVGVKGKFAKQFELHNHVMHGEVMKMEEQSEVIVPAGKTLSFKPGGLHVMIFGLHKPLQKNAEVEFELVTKKGSKIKVTAKVVEPGNKKQGHSHHHHHHH